MKKSNQNIFLSAPFIFTGIIMGIIIGLTSKSLANTLAPFGKIYLSLIQMCVLPIMVTAIISSFGNLFHSDSARLYIKKVFLMFLIGLVCASVFGIIAGVIASPGSHLSENTKLLLSQNIPHIQDLPQSNPQSTGLLQFIANIIPINIFASMDQGNMLSVLFFSMLLGIALGHIRSNATRTTLTVLEGVFSALLKIIDWIMYGLPFGLCCLFAGYMATLGLTELVILGRLVLLFYSTLFLMMIGYSLIIWYYVGGNYWSSIKLLKEPLLIGFGTSSSLSAIPSMLEKLKSKFGLEKDVVDFVVPLGISLNRHGTVLRLVISALFTAQLFHQQLTITHLLIVLVTSILAGIAASGVPGLANVGVLALVLQPLGLPVAVGITLLAAIMPITDPVITLVNVYCNCATAIVATKKRWKAQSLGLNEDKI